MSNSVVFFIYDSQVAHRGAPRGCVAALPEMFTLPAPLRYPRHVSQTSRPKPKDYVQAVGRSIEFIEAHLGEPLDLDSVCREAHLSKFYFSRIFQAMVGETVFDYIRKRRLAEIAGHLIRTEKPMVDLALDYGYDSQQSMTKAFRKQFGVTPGAYRRVGRDRYIFHHPRISAEILSDMKRDFSLRAHVFSLSPLRLAGLHATMPISSPEPVENTRRTFRQRAEAIHPFRCHRGVFEVTLMRRQQLISYSPDEPFDGFIGYSIPSSTRIPNRLQELRIPQSRYLTFRYTGEKSIDRLSSLYRYIFSAGIAYRREPLADRDFFHYYRPADSSMLFFLPIE